MAQVTIRQVAEHAQVSIGAVSSVLNGKNRDRGYSDAMRMRILASVEALNYRPNRLAAGLRGSGTHSVGIIWSFFDLYTGDVAIGRSLIDDLERREYVALQATASHDLDRVHRQINSFIARRVDALVFQAEPRHFEHEGIRTALRQLPHVILTPERIEGLEGDQVIHDRGAAIDQVVDHFIASGRRRLAFALSVGQEPRNAPKWQRFAARCRQRGLLPSQYRLIELDPPRDYPSHGQRHAEGLQRAFDGRPDIDALLCFNDIGALHAAQSLRSMGVSIPGDVALVGFNNTEVCTACSPNLASGDRQQVMASEAMQRLLATRLEQPAAPPRIETVPMQFVWRASAGGECPVSSLH